MLRRSDRYVLREMIGPFLLALAGLTLFILLNIILSLSDLMVDRGVSMPMLLRIVLLKVPSLLVVAIPMSVLFATFLGLGRMVHDREVVALESLGMPLRRVLLPLVFAAGLIAVGDFAVYNWLVPASEGAYQDALRGVIYRQGVPRITSNAFFRGPNDQFLYIRRYDESTGKIYDVHIYDTSGELFPQAQAGEKAQLTLLTADEGVWQDDAWILADAHVYGFDRSGVLLFSAVADTLTLPVDQSVAEIVSRSRTTSEMGIGELVSRVAQGRANGQRVGEYLVEIHLKMALPLSAIVFVLLSGSLSLAFLPRSRAVGVVLGLALVAVYQGALWWTQTLGRRGAMNPALAAWLPDILFGAFGLFLFFRVDRLASRDVWSRVRARLPFLAVTLAAVALFALPCAAAAPVHVDCDELFVSQDETVLRAVGNVSAAFEETSIHADTLTLEQTDSNWRVTASGHVTLRTGEDLTVNSEAFAADVDAGTGALLASSAEATTLTGSTAFTNSEGDRAELFFRAERARLTFEDGELALLEGYASELTTCHCCNVGVAGQPYSLRAEKLLLYPDRLFVAYGITGRAAGVAIVWLPLYVQPLKETLEAPLFPAVGRSATHGWFAKWSLPFFASESLYGYLSIDAYPFTRELGLGGSVRYDVGGQEGELYVYRLPAKVGDSEAKVRLRHTSQFVEGWSSTGALDYAQVGAKEKTTYSFALDGATRLGDVSLVASRALSSTQTAATHVEERLPELTLDVDALSFGTLSVQPRLALGWRREGTLGGTLDEATRLVAQATIAAEPFDLAGLRLTPAASVRGAIYDGKTGRTTQASFAITPGASIGDLDLSWSSTWVFGTSPLESDRASAGHVFRWSFSPREPLDLVFRGSLDLAAGLGPLSVAVAWSAMADWKASGTFEPQDNAVTAFQLSGTWTDDIHTATWLLPWDASSGRFEKSTLELSAVTDSLSLSLAVTADLARRAVSMWKVDAELAASGGWGLSTGAAYTAASQTLVPEFGLFQDIADCLRVGVEYAHGETWLYISILAFPEAVLRYAPRTFEVEVGD